MQVWATMRSVVQLKPDRRLPTLFYDLSAKAGFVAYVTMLNEIRMQTNEARLYL